MPAPIIELDGVSFAFRADTLSPPLQVLRNLDITILAGEFVSIVGPSGCGKTTLLRLIADLLQPSTGSRKVSLPAGTASGEAFGYVFQTANLLPWLTVRDNVSVPAVVTRGTSFRQERPASEAILTDLGLGDFAGAYPWELSVGMQMRVNLGRAIRVRPHILLLDEPFSALDEVTRVQLQADLLQLQHRTGATCVMVTHNVMEAVVMSDRVAVLSSRPATVVAEFLLDGDRPRPWNVDSTRIARAIVERMASTPVSSLDRDAIA